MVGFIRGTFARAMVPGARPNITTRWVQRSLLRDPALVIQLEGVKKCSVCAFRKEKIVSPASKI